MRLAKYIILVMLLAGSVAHAQNLQTATNPVSRKAKGAMIFWWKRVSGATNYKIVVKSYRAENNKYAGQFILSQTADTFISMDVKKYYQKLDGYKIAYCSNNSKPGTKCTLRYETYLIVATGKRESKPVLVKMLWR